MKTVATDSSVSRFIDAIDDPERRRDCKPLVKLMRKITGKTHKSGKSCLYLKRLADVDLDVLEELVRYPKA